MPWAFKNAAPKRRRQQLAHRHDARAHPVVQLAGLARPARAMRCELREEALEIARPARRRAAAPDRGAWSRSARAPSLCSPASAAASRDSSRSVMPESAEWTTTGRSPSAMRSRSTPAILCQLAADDTLVPPNLSTTQAADRTWEARSGVRHGARQGINRLRKCRAALFPTAARPSTSSTRLQAALPRLPAAAALGRRSVRSNRGSKSWDSSASPRNSSSISKCSSSRSLIVREKPLKSMGSISPVS